MKIRAGRLSPWGFSGKRHDPSGLVYFGRRYYLPSEGRWMAPDPAGFVEGPNLHRFCRNHPHAFIDWVGLKSERSGGGGAIHDLDPGGGWGGVDQQPSGRPRITAYVSGAPPNTPPMPTHPVYYYEEPTIRQKAWCKCQNAFFGAAHGVLIRFPVRCANGISMITAYGVAYTVGLPWRDTIISAVRESGEYLLTSADAWGVSLFMPDDPIYYAAAGLACEQAEMTALVFGSGKIAISACRWGSGAFMRLPMVQRMEARICSFIENPFWRRGASISTGETVSVLKHHAVHSVEVIETEINFVNLASPERTTHILKGDITGGGHLYPGQPGKSSFPKCWSGKRIMHEISDVATDPFSTFAHGRRGRTIVTGTRDGLEIKVVIGNSKEGGGIITGFPANGARNP